MEEKLKEIYNYYEDQQSSLGQSELVMAMLREIQDTLGYISQDAQIMTAKIAGVNSGYVAAVIKNMPSLHQQPFKHEIIICTSERCQKKGGGEVLKKFQQVLGIKPGQVTKDGYFLLRVQQCMHNCVNGPNIKIDGEIKEGVSPSDVCEVIRAYKK